MAQDPAGRAVLVGGVTILAAWVAVAVATAWLFIFRETHPIHSGWLWAGGLTTALGAIVLGILIFQVVASFSGKRERDYQAYLKGLQADEQRRTDAADETR